MRLTEDQSPIPPQGTMDVSFPTGLYSNLQINRFSALGENMSGFYQQLLKHASTGALMRGNDGLCEKPQVYNHYPPEESYDAGAESDDEGTTCTSGEEMDEVHIMDNKIEHYIYDGGASTTDLNYGRDLDYEYVERGVDDTVHDTGTDVEENYKGQNSVTFIDQGGDLSQSNVGDGVCVNEYNKDDVTVSYIEDSGCAHEISQRYLDEVYAGYKKRYRPSDDVTAECREAREMGALEIAMRKSSHRKPGENIFEPILGMVFDSKEEAYEYYNMYAWEVGFSIIYNCSRKRDDGERSKQEITCQKGGRDRRVQNATRKEKCKARIVLLRNGDGGWYISNIVKDHNHQLVESCCEKRELGSHKRLDPNTLQMIRYLRQHNIGQAKVRCIVGKMYGSLKDAPCTKRTVRAVCTQISREQMDNDVAKTIDIFKDMRAKDPEFQWSVETGDDNTINTLMWCTGKSREQYKCFGDVVTFDTTYCTNFYKMPFGLFVGVNNHFQTIVFAGVLMRQESIESFKWVFSEFLTLMGGKAPETVFTDQCKSMTLALAEVWQTSFHLWCKWHVLKSIREGLGPLYTKNAVFREEFYAIVNEMLTKEEFVSAWKDLCTRYNITENPFMVRTFQCRSKWAKPWSKGHYCAGMTSTQRSESANMMLKKFVPRNSSMNVFVSQYNVLLEDRDLEEGRQENITMQVMVKKGRMWPIERHALKIYTRASFYIFRRQVDKAANFVVDKKGEGFCDIIHNYRDKMPEWKKTTFRVYIIEDRERYHCECGLYEHLGVLCCHTLRLLIQENVSEIPKAHIMKRWTRDAKDMLPNARKEHQTALKKSDSASFNRFKLNSKALEAITKGNTDEETQQVVMKYLDAAIKEVDEILLSRATQAKVPSPNEIDVQTDIEGMLPNQYGASGSSAGMSDNDIKTLKAPSVDKTKGCARVKRFLGGAELAIRKSKSKRKRAKWCGLIKDIDMLDEGIEPVEISPGLPYQSTFCTKCKKKGHNKKTCGARAKKAKTVSTDEEDLSGTGAICTKCGLKGHNEKQCLVAEDDYNSFFK